MVVKAQSQGRGNAALFVGENNVRRYFADRVTSVELRLGELHINCHLPAEFWLDSPVINDPRLCAWLQSCVFHRRTCRESLPLSMIRLGKNSFSLQAIQPVPNCEKLCGTRSNKCVLREKAVDSGQRSAATTRQP